MIDWLVFNANFSNISTKLMLIRNIYYKNWSYLPLYNVVTSSIRWDDDDVRLDRNA
jgi:hypothetical protein